MRTSIKSKDHFDWFITKQKERIERFEHNIEIGQTKEERIPTVKSQIFEIGLHLLIAKYSAGSPIAPLREDFLDVIVKFEQGWQDKGDIPEDNLHFDSYVLALWMLSLGVLLAIEVKDYRRIVDVLDKSIREDQLFDFMIASVIHGRRKSEKLSYPKQFLFLKNLIETKDITSLQKYLDKEWYKSMRLSYWYDNHKSKADTFFGYWSWETAAVAKILGLEDNVIKDQQYYPYELVHWDE